MIKKISYLLVVITLFLGFHISVNASGTNHIVDFSKTGSIEVTLHEEQEDTYVNGALITIYKIADAYSDNGNLAFKYTEEFSGCNVSLEDMTDENLTKEISSCVSESSKGISKITNREGKVNFLDLSLGLYLVKQTNKVEGYSKIDSFLVHIPKVIDNSWTYNIVANPKTEIYKEIDIVVQKVWNTQSSSIPKKVEIELYRDSDLIDTITLSDSNHWTYTWNDLEKSDNYSVKEINVPKGYKVSYSNNDYVFTVTNTDTLAKTGQFYYSIIISVVLGLLFILIGTIAMRKNNNE